MTEASVPSRPHNVVVVLLDSLNRHMLGAYGGTVEASKSWCGEPPCETIIAGDINGDCRVDFKDFQILSLHWLESGNNARE